MKIEHEQLVKKLKEQSKQYGLECGCLEYTSGRVLVEISTGPLVDHIPGLLRLEIMPDYIRVSELSVNWFDLENGKIIDNPLHYDQAALRKRGWRKYDGRNCRSRKGDFEFDLSWLEAWIRNIKEKQCGLDSADVNE